MKEIETDVSGSGEVLETPHATQVCSPLAGQATSLVVEEMSADPNCQIHLFFLGKISPSLNSQLRDVDIMILLFSSAVLLLSQS